MLTLSERLQAAPRWLPAGEIRAFCDGLRAGAAARERVTRRDEKAAIEAAYGSASEWAWQLADLLVDMVAGGRPGWERRAVRMAIEGEVRNG